MTMAEKMKNIRAFVVGYTGQVGLKLVDELATNAAFSEVKLIGRREVEELKGDKYSKCTQHVVDFEKLENHPEAFSETDVGYCTLGTTRGKSGVEGFKKVDFDFVVASAGAAKRAGVEEFHLVSSTGANKSSSFLYPQTKGRVEEAVSEMGFERTYIYRPAGLIGTNRSETRIGEKVAGVILYPIVKMFPTAATIPIQTVAKAMLNVTLDRTLAGQSASEDHSKHDGQNLSDDAADVTKGASVDDGTGSDAGIENGSGAEAAPKINRIFTNKEIHQLGEEKNTD